MKGLEAGMAKRVVACLMAFAAAAMPATAGEPRRQKAIDFEDQVVEGMNRRPLDSLRQDGEAGDPRRRPHLYRFRRGFSGETEVTLREMRWTR